MDAFKAMQLTLELAGLTTALLLVIATPIAWWLSQSKSWLSSAVGAIVTLPLVLPPTVLGFYLLIAIGPQGFIGYLTQILGIESLAFTFSGLLIGSLIYSLPFAVQPIQHAFEALGDRPLEVAATLRASPTDAFFSIALPMAKSGFINAAILTFAHTIGEFGMVLMIGGNIPDKTRVISTLIYGHVEALEYTQAHWLAGGMLIFSFAILLCLKLLNRRATRVML